MCEKQLGNPHHISYEGGGTTHQSTPFHWYTAQVTSTTGPSSRCKLWKEAHDPWYLVSLSAGNSLVIEMPLKPYLWLVVPAIHIGVADVSCGKGTPKFTEMLAQWQLLLGNAAFRSRPFD